MLLVLLEPIPRHSQDSLSFKTKESPAEIEGSQKGMVIANRYACVADLLSVSDFRTEFSKVMNPVSAADRPGALTDGMHVRDAGKKKVFEMFEKLLDDGHIFNSQSDRQGLAIFKPQDAFFSDPNRLHSLTLTSSHSASSSAAAADIEMGSDNRARARTGSRFVAQCQSLVLSA